MSENYIWDYKDCDSYQSNGNHKSRIIQWSLRFPTIIVCLYVSVLKISLWANRIILINFLLLSSYVKNLI